MLHAECLAGASLGVDPVISHPTEVAWSTTVDPDTAGALEALVAPPLGALIVVIVGVGFSAFGLCNEFRARFNRL